MFTWIPGSLSGATFAPRDVFWGQLGGCLEALDGGTTTVVDHSNINNSPAHSMSLPARSTVSTPRMKMYLT